MTKSSLRVNEIMDRWARMVLCLSMVITTTTLFLAGVLLMLSG